jgi:aryl-alcohol dehydrogenase-like predicted oxidoreductase
MNRAKATRKKFFQSTLGASLGMAIAPSVLKGESQSSPAPNSLVKEEWRNRQPGMAYRMFGNTGMMVSELVQGTNGWVSDKELSVFDVAFERGVNYLDTSPAYKKGLSEKLVGQYLKKSGNRDRLFVSNKISFYDEYMTQLSNEIFNGLPAEKQARLRTTAQEMIAERGVLRPGYHYTYFKNQESKFEKAYLRHLINQEYGMLNAWKPKIKKRMHELVEASLKTTNTDYFDVLHCPHGVAMPEMLEDEHIREVLAELKQKGVIRFSALSMHNDVAANLKKAIELGHYNGAMVAYNIGNHESLDGLIGQAKQAGMGIVAMKVARILQIENTPDSEIEALETSINEPLSKYAKAYLWALQNSDLSCCVSDMVTLPMVAENTSVSERKIILPNR